MRNFVFLAIGLSLISLLSACGQSGALMLPSDPNYDKRSQYILHHPKSVDSTASSADKSDQTASTHQD